MIDIDVADMVSWSYNMNVLYEVKKLSIPFRSLLANRVGELQNKEIKINGDAASPCWTHEILQQEEQSGTSSNKLS